MDASEAALLIEQVRRSRIELYGGDGVTVQREAVAALARLASAESAALAGEPTAADAVSAEQVHLAGISLSAMLDGWSEAALWKLIDAERVMAPRRQVGVILHIVATNTPLQCWSSVARALLIGASSVVRLPRESAEVNYWAERFHVALEAASPELSKLIAYVQWPSERLDVTETAASAADTVVVYGSDETVAAVQRATPGEKRFVGYGSRFSVAYVERDADIAETAAGIALDMLIFDQQGCLSPQFAFVEGGVERTRRFGEHLAAELARLGAMFSARSKDDAARTAETLALARFEAGAWIRHDREYAWSVIVSPGSGEPTFGVRGQITILPISSVEAVRGWLDERGLLKRLQGIAYARAATRVTGAERSQEIDELGASYVCAPGWLQRPPFTWREDNLDVLRSFLSDE